MANDSLQRLQRDVAAQELFSGMHSIAQRRCKRYPSAHMIYWSQTRPFPFPSAAIHHQVYFRVTIKICETAERERGPDLPLCRSTTASTHCRSQADYNAHSSRHWGISMGRSNSRALWMSILTFVSICFHICQSIPESRLLRSERK